MEFEPYAPPQSSLQSAPRSAPTVAEYDRLSYGLTCASLGVLALGLLWTVVATLYYSHPRPSELSGWVPPYLAMGALCWQQRRHLWLPAVLFPMVVFGTLTCGAGLVVELSEWPRICGPSGTAILEWFGFGVSLVGCLAVRLVEWSRRALSS